jgi:hypothetical protein
MLVGSRGVDRKNGRGWWRKQEHLPGETEMTFLSVFLDHTFAGLKEGIDCIGSKYSFKSSLDTRE